MDDSFAMLFDFLDVEEQSSLQELNHFAPYEILDLHVLVHLRSQLTWINKREL